MLKKCNVAGAGKTAIPKYLLEYNFWFLTELISFLEKAQLLKNLTGT